MDLSYPCLICNIFTFFAFLREKPEFHENCANYNKKKTSKQNFQRYISVTVHTFKIICFQRRKPKLLRTRIFGENSRKGNGRKRNVQKTSVFCYFSTFCVLVNFTRTNLDNHGKVYLRDSGERSPQNCQKNFVNLRDIFNLLSENCDYF